MAGHTCTALKTCRTSGQAGGKLMIITSMRSRNYHKSVITKPQLRLRGFAAVLIKTIRFITYIHRLICLLQCLTPYQFSWFSETVKQWQIIGQPVIREGEGIHLWHQVTVSSIDRNIWTANQSLEPRYPGQWRDGWYDECRQAQWQLHALVIMWSGPESFLDLLSQSQKWFYQLENYFGQNRGKRQETESRQETKAYCLM